MIAVADQILYYENFDLESLATPIKVDRLQQLLEATKYPQKETKFIVDGFTNGFSIRYEGNMEAKLMAPNLPLSNEGDYIMLWNKIMKEVKAGRFAGPFKQIPFEDHYIQSPVGLIPKDDGKDMQLIFHLSYSKNKDTLVSANTPADLWTVKYPDFIDAIQMCLKVGKNCKISRSDMKLAFRHLCIRVKDFWLLLMKAKSPLDNKIYWFVDKALPFGSSILCSHFQRFSNCIAHIVKSCTWNDNLINYLDDYLFCQIIKALCDNNTREFITVCQYICLPVNLDKTFWGTTRLVFLGLLIDAGLQMVFVLIDKIQKANAMTDKILNNNKSKETLHQLQKLCGFLNFLCKCVVPGRAFTRRLYTLTSNEQGKLMPHHHICFNEMGPADVEAIFATSYFIAINLQILQG